MAAGLLLQHIQSVRRPDGTLGPDGPGADRGGAGRCPQKTSVAPHQALEGGGIHAVRVASLHEVERFPKLDVAGSNPVSRSRINDLVVCGANDAPYPTRRGAGVSIGI